MKMDILKKYINVIVCLCLLLILTACQKQPTWQEQYDLGMKYLTESDYEEAILAFTAAIEIDPQQAEAYLQLAEAYMAAGKTRQAILTLQQGLETTGDAGLQRRLEELQQPAQAADLDAVDPAFAAKAGFQLFDDLPAEQQRLIQQTVDLADQGRMEDLQQLVSSGLSVDLLTMYQGYKIQIITDPNLPYERYTGIKGTQSPMTSFGPGIIVQIRPEQGQGYVCSYYSRLGAEGTEAVADMDMLECLECPCVDWQFEGSYGLQVSSNIQNYNVSSVTDTATGETVIQRNGLSARYLNTSSFEGTVTRNVFTRQRGRMMNVAYDTAGNELARSGNELSYHMGENGISSGELIPIDGVMSMTLTDITAANVTLETW